MTFVELREEADALCEVWGYSNTPRPPNWFNLVNQAYKDFCWDTDAVQGPEVTITTVINQAEYNVRTILGDNRDWKSFLDVLYNGQKIFSTDISVIRRRDNLWMTRVSGTPLWFWIPRLNTIRLYSPPDSAVTLTLNGIRSAILMANDTDIPVIADRFHASIAVRAAYLHARKYAKGQDQLTNLASRLEEYSALVSEGKQENCESGVDGDRIIAPIVAERMFI